MKYYYALYMDEYAKENQADIIRKIENDKWQMNIYLVVLTKGEKNHMEVFHSVLLIQKVLSKDDLFVVGIANGYFDALELVEKITQEVYDETGDVDIRNYILQKQQKHEEERV